MEELYNYNLDDEDIKHILEINNDIFTLTSSEILEKINILINLGCSIDTIKHVIVTNPYFLTNELIDIKNLINILSYLDIINYEEILNINPFILNNNVYDMEEYIKINKNKGYSDKYILDNIIRDNL